VFRVRDNSATREQSGTWGGPLSVPLHLVACTKEIAHLLLLAPNLKLTPPE
jgi:hypothetical protein